MEQPPLVRRRGLAHAAEAAKHFTALFGFQIPLPGGHGECQLVAFARAYYAGVLDGKIIERYAGNWHAMKSFAHEHKRRAERALKAGDATGFNTHVHAWMACKALASRHTTHASLLADFREAFGDAPPLLVRGTPPELLTDGAQSFWHAY